MEPEVEPGIVVRILLAAEYALFRDSIRDAMETHPDLAVVAEAGDAERAVQEAVASSPTVALVDVTLPGGGLSACAAIKEQAPGCLVVLIGEEDEAILIEGLEAGAAGYVSRSGQVADVVEAIRSAADGLLSVPRTMVAPLVTRLLRRHRQRSEALEMVSRLTRREREVAALLAEGADNEAIARALLISPETARTHIQRVLTKLNVHSRLAAAAFVIHNGLLPQLAGSER